jgi:hypothetical protein
VLSTQASQSRLPSHALGRQVTTYWPEGHGDVHPASDGVRRKHQADPLTQTFGQGVPAGQVTRGSGTQMRPAGQF